MKTRTFVLNDTITPKRIKQLISKIELSKCKCINLHIASDGGMVDMANIFINFTWTTDKKINLIGSDRLISARIDIFLEAKGKKSLYPYTTALLHMNSADPESRDLLNNKSFASIQMKQVNAMNEDKIIRYSNVFSLTDEEILFLKNGGDLGIDYERLKKALPKINKLTKSR